MPRIRFRASLRRAAPLLALVALAGQTVLPSSAAAVPSQPLATLSCASGVVTTTGPGIVANQNVRGATTPDAVWFAKLYQWNGTSWEWYQVSDLFTAEVESNAGPSMGTTMGYAGPTWYRSTNAEAVTSISFNVTPGYYYSIDNYVWDGTWVHADAPTSWAAFNCQA